MLDYSIIKHVLSTKYNNQSTLECNDLTLNSIFFTAKIRKYKYYCKFSYLR